MTTPAMTSAPTFLEMFRAGVRAEPDRVACGVLADGATVTGTVTYAELDRAAGAVADELQRTLAPSARVVLLAEPTLEFVAGFLGCLYAGICAVPMPPPGPPRPQAGAERLRRVADDAGAEALLLTGVQDDPGVADLPVVRVGTGGDAHRWRDPGVHAHTVAFLQYTSGSTRVPNAVVVDEGNLAANVAAMSYALRVPRGKVSLSWLPLYHDMGLIQGLLLGLATGGTSYLMNPLHFVQQPSRWAAAVSKVQAYISGAPNFAFELAARKTTDEQVAALDLTGWRTAYNGAEPVRASTMERFAARFAPAGLDPAHVVGCYGLAESTLLVSATWPVDRKWLSVDRDALEHGTVRAATDDRPAKRVVTAGRVPPEHQVAIVDPVTHERVDAGQVGEIWVSGPSVTRGYWRDDDDTFAAHLRGTTGPDFLRTGDLGFRHDELLFVSGRLKDVLIVHGRNVQPQDVEDVAVDAHPLLRPGGAAAFQLDDGRIAVVAEVAEAGPGTQVAAEIRTALREHVMAEQQVAVSLVALAPPRAVPKTSSGKVRRQRCRALLADGFFEQTPASADADAAPPVPAMTGPTPVGSRS